MDYRDLLEKFKKLGADHTSDPSAIQSPAPTPQEIEQTLSGPAASSALENQRLGDIARSTQPPESDEVEAMFNTAPIEELSPAENSTISKIKPILERLEKSKPITSSEPTTTSAVSPVTSSEDIDQELEDAKKRDNLMSLLSGLNRSGAMIGSALSRGAYQIDPSLYKYDNDALKQLSGIRKLQEQKLELDQEKQAQDVNSPMSKSLRDALKNLGVTVPENMSYNAIQKSNLASSSLMAQARKDALVAQRENAEINREQNRLRQGELNLARNARLEETQAKRLTAAIKAAEDKGNTATNKARSNLIQANNIYATLGIPADATEKDIDNFSANKLDEAGRIMVAETAVELNRLLSGTGTPAQKTLEKLIPNNAKMDATKLKDYFTNKLNPAQQSEFLRAAAKIAKRVENQSKPIVQKHIVSMFDSVHDLREANPERFERSLNTHGMTLEDYDKYTNVRPMAKKRETPAAPAFDFSKFNKIGPSDE